MAEIKLYSALAGLLADPQLAGLKDQIVPSQWLQGVEQANPAALRAAKLVAGTETEPSKGELSGPLQSIFNSIKTSEGGMPAPVFWPQQPLELSEGAIMPQPEVKPSGKPWSDFLSQAKELKALYNSAGEDQLPVFIENLLMLMQRNLWCLPCGYQAILPDVSLYDHSRLTAALASALAENTADGPLALLVGGDISGVQRFLYTITSKGATSALRGRSFYLQILTEACVRFLLRRLGLPATSLIYAGGGNFYFLAPPDADLVALRAYISRMLLHHHAGDLYLAVAGVSLQEADFYEGRIAGCWQALTEALGRAKLQPFAELGEGLADVFVPQGHGGNEDLQCQVCGLEHPGTKLVTKTSEEEGVRICPACASYEELGKDLRSAGYLVFQQIPEATLPDEKEPVPGTWEQVLAHFGMKVLLSRHLPQIDGDSTALLLALKDEGESLPKPSPSLVIGRRFLVNVTPLVQPKDLDDWIEDPSERKPEPGDIKPYDLLESQSTGIQRLGVLRMDVDNLSKIFSSGLGKQATLSRLGALSFAVSLFFEGWVGHLAEEQNHADEHGERLYSIYSGGDDLFFVGSWDAVVELARQIRADLGRFAGNHPGVHASAGLVLVGGKYPLYQAAQDAGVAEEEAKSNQWLKGDAMLIKDSITFLGQSIEWERFGLQGCTDSEVQTVHAWSHRLESALMAKDSPRALLSLLIRLQGQYDAEARKRRQRGTDLNQNRKKQILWGPWNWLGVYYLHRMQKRSAPEFKDMLENILALFESDQFSNIQWIGLAARWAELKLRNRSSTQEVNNGSSG